MKLRTLIDETLDIAALATQFQQLKKDKAEEDKNILQNPVVAKAQAPLSQKTNQSMLGLEKSLGILIQQDKIQKQLAQQAELEKQKQAAAAQQATTAGNTVTNNGTNSAINANGQIATKTTTANR